MPAADGTPVLLDNLVTVTEESRPPQLYRFDRFSSATVSAGLAPGETLGDGIAAMDEIADRVLDERFATALDRPVARLRRVVERACSSPSSSRCVLIYLVLAAQFESFLDPLIILSPCRSRSPARSCSLWYFGQTLNLFSQIGMIMLIGLVTKNGILIVEFANQRRAAGLGRSARR